MDISSLSSHHTVPFSMLRHFINCYILLLFYLDLKFITQATINNFNVLLLPDQKVVLKQEQINELAESHSWLLAKAYTAFAHCFTVINYSNTLHVCLLSV